MTHLATSPVTRLKPEALHYPAAVAALNGRTLIYTLRESARARRPNLWMDPSAGLVVTIPKGTASETAAQFLTRHQRWILRGIARVERRWLDQPKRWPYGERLLYRGQPMAVRVIPARTGKVEITDADEIIVATRTSGIEGARRVLTRWLKQQALDTLTARMQALAPAMGLAPRRVYVRTLRRTWGSCWPGGSLSFSYQLIMAPPEVLDYVVVHELAHLKERNHSPRFWALVATHHPDYHTRRAWLRTHGPWLAV